MGIRIVENHAPVHEGVDRWKVSDTPALVLGAEEPLYDIRGATRLTDGRIVVANAGSRELLFFGMDGNVVSRAGGQGEGPGEFRRLEAFLPLSGDSLAGFDFRPHSYSVFDPDGKFVRRVNVETPPGLGMVTQLLPSGFVEGGDLVANVASMILSPQPSASPVYRPESIYLRFGPDGSFADTVAVVPGVEWASYEYRDRSYTIRAPFGHGLPAVASNDRVFHGAGERYELVAYDPAGAVRMLIRRREVDRAVTPRDIDALQERLMGDGSIGPEALRRLERRFEEIPYPSQFPPYQRLLIDKPGNLWVQEYPRPDQTEVSWSVFDENGTWLSDISIPTDLRVVEIGEDYLLGVWRDDLDVEFLRLHSVSK